MIILGLTAAFYGVAIGLTQRDPKVLLAYSSISQIGVITMALGLGMLVPHDWPLILPVVAFYALHHGLSKGALFLGVDLTGSTNRIQRWWIWLGLWLPALALAGAPWTSGMLAKQLLKTTTLYAPLPWDSLLPLLLSLSAFTTALLMLRLLYLVRPNAQPFGIAPAAGLVRPWLILLLTVLLVPVWLVFLMPDLEAGTISVNDSLWPIVLALIIVWAVLQRGVFRKIQPLPAGDVLVLMEHSLRLLYALGNSLINLIYHWKKWQIGLKTRFIDRLMAAKERIQKMEDNFARWDVAILFVIIIALSMGLIAKAYCCV